MDYNPKYRGGVVTDDHAYRGVEESAYGPENFNRGPTPRPAYEAYDRYGSDRYSTDRFNEKRGRRFDHMGDDLPHGANTYAGPEGMSDYDRVARTSEKDLRGRGPKNYVRSDETILDDICHRLYEAEDVNAENIDVTVENGCVSLMGSVDSRAAKYRADDIAEYTSGVKEVKNNLRVIEPNRR